MLADEFPDMDARGPRAVGGTPVTLHVYVEDVDSVFDRGDRAGAKALRPVEDQFYGDRSGQFEDPFGHRWNVATHVEDVPPRRWRSAQRQQCPPVEHQPTHPHDVVTLRLRTDSGSLPSSSEPRRESGAGCVQRAP